MKKLFGIAALGAAALTLSSCGDTYEIALITDGNRAGVEDKSFMQGAWEGIENYTDGTGKTHKFYEPQDSEVASIMTMVDAAVKAGAEIIVTPGYTFEEAVHQAANKYKDVKFVLLDGQTDSNYNSQEVEYVQLPNVASITYREDEAGFLAGYAAVEAGFRNLGFMGGFESAPVTRFGNGFIAGAEAAAQTLEIPQDQVKINFSYINTYVADSGVQNTATSWYAGGTEVIFVAAGGAGSSVMAAANARQNAYVIGVDINQREDSDTVIYSATKGLATSVEMVLADYYDNGGSTYIGKSTSLDINNDGVALEGGYADGATDGVWDRVPNSGNYSGYTDDKYNAVVTNLKNPEYQYADLLDGTSDASYTSGWTGLVKVTTI